MEKLDFCELAEKLYVEEKIIAIRRRLHQNPELGMDLPKTTAFVKKELLKMGLAPKTMGPSGIVVDIKGHQPGKTILLRADMDALPIEEETDVVYKSTNGCMHACGHDMHTAMLLGAAMILRERQPDLNGRVRLMFQPGEETDEGAMSMIEEGVLENPSVDAALSLHVVTGLPVKVASVGVPLIEGGFMSAADTIEISVQGKGGHGAMPEKTIDALNVLTHIHIALQSLNAREIAASDVVALTFGVLNCGTAFNVIADSGVLKGSLRTFNEETRNYLHKRIEEIAKGVASQFRAEAEVTIEKGMPPLNNSKPLAIVVKDILSDYLGSDSVLAMKDFYSERLMASEDFAHVAQRVSSTIIKVGAGNSEEGYLYPMHHPKAKFDEKALLIGAKAYACVAIGWLDKN